MEEQQPALLHQPLSEESVQDQLSVPPTLQQQLSLPQLQQPPVTPQLLEQSFSPQQRSLNERPEWIIRSHQTTSLQEPANGSDADVANDLNIDAASAPVAEISTPVSGVPDSSSPNPRKEDVCGLHGCMLGRTHRGICQVAPIFHRRQPKKAHIYEASPAPPPKKLYEAARAAGKIRPPQRRKDHHKAHPTVPLGESALCLKATTFEPSMFEVTHEISSENVL